MRYNFHSFFSPFFSERKISIDNIKRIDVRTISILNGKETNFYKEYKEEYIFRMETLALNLSFNLE